MTPTTSTPATFHGNRVDQQFIAGQWRDGATGDRASDINPYTDDVVAEFNLATAEDLDEAYRAAAAAQEEWAATPPKDRAAVLRRAAEILEERRDEVIDWLVKEAGSTRIKADSEVSLAIAITQEAASFPTRVHGKIFDSNTPNRETRVYRKPVGVVGVISPWNFPLHLSQRSVAPALALGNAVVLKPASDTAVTGGTLIARVFEEAGLPAGVLSVVVGSGSEIGDAFVTHPVPRLISFTGSTAVGKQVAANAVTGDTIKKVALELGGNAPLVVLDDADLGRAVDAAIFGSFFHQGQICMIANRLIVDVCTELEARVLLKGLRGETDFSYEWPMGLMNRHLTGVETLFIPGDPRHEHVSSSLVKEVARFGGDVTGLVSDEVRDALVERLPRP